MSKPLERSGLARRSRARRLRLPVLIIVAALAALAGVAFVAARGPADETRAARVFGTISVVSATHPRAVSLVSPASGTTRKITAPDVVIRADLSPDGRRLAVAALDGLWVMRRDGSGRRRIYRAGDVGPSDLAWSRDGQRLAFVLGDARNSLFTIAADARPPKRVTTRAATPDWGPGGEIVFVHRPEMSSRNGTISAVAGAGGRVRTIIARGAWYGPRISPDGSRLAFYRNGSKGIYVAPAKGGTARLVVRDGTHPEWSPDGRYLAFTREVSCGHAMCSSRVFIVPASGGKARARGPAFTDIGPISWSR